MKNSERDFDEGEMDVAEANDLVFVSDDEGDVTFVDSSGSCLSSDEESDLDRRILGEISDDDEREESTAADGCAHATDRRASDDECGAELVLGECQDNRADTVSSGSCSVSAVSQSISHMPSGSSSSSSSDSDEAEESTPRRRANPARRATTARGAGRRGGRGAVEGVVETLRLVVAHLLQRQLMMMDGNRRMLCPVYQSSSRIGSLVYMCRTILSPKMSLHCLVSFFSSAILTTLADLTNEYADQYILERQSYAAPDGSWHSTTADELRKFIACITVKLQYNVRGV